MAHTGTLQVTAQVSSGMRSIAGVVTKTADGIISKDTSLPAGKAGTLSTRTSNTAGEATLAADHGIATGNVVDVHWVGGVHYGVTVGTVSGTAVPLTDSGSGDNYPAEDFAIVVTKQVEITASFDGDDAELMAAICDQNAHLDFQDVSASLFAMSLTAGVPWAWGADMGTANPLTGNACVKILASNGSVTAATLKVDILHDTTP